MGNGGPVTFFLPPGEPFAALSRLDPDRDWMELQRGERTWILQTYLRLARAGLPVELSDRAAPGIVVYHATSWRALQRQRSALAGGDALFVGVRADLNLVPNADVEIVQNRTSAGGRRRVYVPHWPQPALLPRDPGRGDRVETVAFKGIRGSLHADLQSPLWTQALERLGLAWEADEMAYTDDDESRRRLRWNDYRETDLVVALRPRGRRLHPSKPATKLVNAWLAGVPAILGPEAAFREERESPLDYIEVADVQEAIVAVQRLASDPGLYRAMIDHGRHRALAFSTEILLERWRELLFETLPPLARELRSGRGRRLLAGRARRMFSRR
jgi:hypothetical protein